MRQREISLDRSVGRRTPADRDGTLAMWDDHVRLLVPDERLADAVDVARSRLVGCTALHVEGRVPGVARLARRLAAQSPDDDRLEKILGVLRSRVRDGVVPASDGRPDAAATAALGICEVAQMDPRAWDRVDGLADLLLAGDDGPTGLPDAALGAALLELLTHLLAAARPEGLVLLPVLDDSWFGEDVSVHGLPVVGGGRVSWSVTWPGDWPVLQWATSSPGLRVTAPGLAPGWADSRPRGRVDLTPVHP